MEQQHQDRATIKQRVAAGGLKATHQRIVILEALSARHSQHPTAEEVLQSICLSHPSISLGTIYKTLDSFVEAGLVRRVFSEEGGRRYDANMNAHNHIYCSNTREIIDYEDEELEQLLTDFFRKRHMENFDLKGFSVQLTGNKVEPGKSISIKQSNK